MRIAFLLLFLVVSAISVHGQSLELNFILTKEAKGKVYAQVFDDQEKLVKEIILQVATNKVTTVITLPKGEYAIKAFHDVNSNGKLDTNPFGIPKEPYGFSNNVRGSFGPPSFDSQLFALLENRSMSINLR